MYKIYQYLKEQRICLAYLGLINDNITDKFIDLSEFFMEHSTHLGKLKNKTSFLIAECFQNTIRHREKTQIIPGHKDYFQISAWEGGVVLASCNLIEEGHVDELQKKIQYINSLTAEDLKKLHDEVLTNGGFSSKGGASLGLIDMARKSGLPIHYNFTSLNNKVSQFFIALEIINQKEAIHVPRISLYLKKEKDFYKDLVEKNILMLYRGEFSHETMLPLIEMLENNLINEETGSSKDKKKLVTIVEVLQNISKHAKIVENSRAGIFSITEENGGMVLESGNFVTTEDKENLTRRLDAIKAMSMDEIVAMYKKRLAIPDISEDGNSGLGLLEIARNSSKQFSYSFTETPDKEIFYSIKINLL